MKTHTENSDGTCGLLRKADVARLLAVSTRTVDSFLAAGLPHLKITARLTRFNRDLVLDWATRTFGTSRRGGLTRGGKGAR